MALGRYAYIFMKLGGQREKQNYEFDSWAVRKLNVRTGRSTPIISI